MEGITESGKLQEEEIWQTVIQTCMEVEDGHNIRFAWMEEHTGTSHVVQRQQLYEVLSQDSSEGLHAVTTVRH